MNTITTQDANLLWNIYWNVFGNTNETVNFFKTIRLDWETSRFKTRVYKDKDYIDVDLWPILTWQILYSSIYYNYYDNIHCHMIYFQHHLQNMNWIHMVLVQ